MERRYYIYQLLGWPDGPIIPVTATVPGMNHAYYADPIKGYETIDEAEKQLVAQESDEKLQGHFIILPVYILKEPKP